MAKEPRIIPDIINCRPESNFTQVRNEMLRDENLSLKGKGLLTLLLSNKQGWFSYSEVLKTFCSDGDTSIRTGLNELEEKGYLLRIRYRDKDTKTIKGSFWAYTDLKGEFDLDATLEYLDVLNFELILPNTENPTYGYRSCGEPKTNNTIYKKRLTSEFFLKNSLSKKKEEKLTPNEQFYKDRVMEQIKDTLAIPQLMELATPYFIRSMEKYVPTKKELSYFIENFNPDLLLYYKEYLVDSIMDEKLNFNGEMRVPRIALLNSNPVRRSHLEYAAENSEDIEYSLKLLTKVPVIT